MKARFASLVISSLVLIVACDDKPAASNDSSVDTGAGDTGTGDSSVVLDAGDASTFKPSCVAIHTACHEEEGVSAEALECHEFGHDEASTEAQCSARLAACQAACSHSHGDAGTDAGHGDAGDGGDGHNHEH